MFSWFLINTTASKHSARAGEGCWLGVSLRQPGRGSVPALLVVAWIVSLLVWTSLQASETNADLQSAKQQVGNQVGNLRYPTNAPTPTFTKDVAPIVFSHCASCHRPGESAPFPLLTYEDARKHGKDMAEVTASRYMPPWLPAPGYGEFKEERRLSQAEIEVIRRWVAQGMQEGEAADLPPRPQWVEGWQLGQPDLILEMPTAYDLPAEGKDIYRNFVVPVPLDARRYVRAIEFRPGNPKIVHHAFIRVDPTRQSRRLEGKDGEPGFPGMSLPDSVQMVEGHFLTWQPGKIPSPEPKGLSWILEKGTDLVFQLHLRPSGKPEILKAKIGLFFTDSPPAERCFKLVLTRFTLNIPPNQTNYNVEDSFVLPADARVLSVLPHAHYLCKRMEGFATLPDGTMKWLLLIKDWDFNWQGDYRYAQPVFLPKGTTLSMHYIYDNSTNNVRNPHNPPEPVRYGAQSSDEMAELWFQLLPSDAADLKVLAQALETKILRVCVDYNENLLASEPHNAKAHLELAVALLGQGRVESGKRQLEQAVRDGPKADEPHYLLGLLFRQQDELIQARREFQTALQLNPGNFKAEGNLGVVFAAEGKLDLAERHLRAALRIYPEDPLAKACLDELLKARASQGR